jgi:hypothetical protein
MGNLVEQYPIELMAVNIILSPPPEPGDLTPAVADTKNEPFSKNELDSYHNASFVDDDGICAIHDHIVPALH